MLSTPLTYRLATPDDGIALRNLMDLAIKELQKPFLTDRQIIASRTLMGLDQQLIADRTYFVVEFDGLLVGCGGWSYRRTLYSGDDTPGRSAHQLSPGVDPARVRAMYTHPSHTRKGIAKMILNLCEAAAKSNGFNATELMATLAGEPLYKSNGYERLETVEADVGELKVPLIRMRKVLA
jgi:GNAT superfamily N-acetyltransferase